MHVKFSGIIWRNEIKLAKYTLANMWKKVAIARANRVKKSEILLRKLCVRHVNQVFLT